MTEIELKEEDIEIVRWLGIMPESKIRIFVDGTHLEQIKEVEQLKQQILRDREDAKKWRANSALNCPVCQFDYDWETWAKDRQIVKRLEKRKANLHNTKKPPFTEDYSFDDIISILDEEFQKILE